MSQSKALGWSYRSHLHTLGMDLRVMKSLTDIQQNGDTNIYKYYKKWSLPLQDLCSTNQVYKGESLPLPQVNEVCLFHTYLLTLMVHLSHSTINSGLTPCLQSNQPHHLYFCSLMLHLSQHPQLNKFYNSDHYKR